MKIHGLTQMSMISRKLTLVVQELFPIKQSAVSAFVPSEANIPDLACTLLHVPLHSGSAGFLEIAGVSFRGSSHQKLGISRQDSFSVTLTSNSVVLAVSDGVSSSSQSHLGSGFVTLNLSKALSHVFQGQVSNDPEKWGEINSWLSRGLVGIHEAAAKSDGLPVQEDTVKRRLEAGKKLAATLEVLVCELTPNEDNSLNCFSVKITGDATALFQEFGSKSNPRLLDSFKDGTGTVSALPITDEIPRIVNFRISERGYAAVVSDGIGDVLHEKSAWMRSLKQLLSSRRGVSHNSLSRFITQKDAAATDDRTFTSLRYMA